MAFVSCKKETEKTLNQKDYTIQQTTDVRQIEDISSYLKDFKKKMTEGKLSEAYNLDDAAWHLASLANLDFCKVNVDYDNVLFDTIEMQVNVTDGVVLLSDLNTAYEQMSKEIQQFKNGFSHNNQNLYFITVSIGNDGNAKIALMTSFNSSSKFLWDHTWYYGDDYLAACACDEFFSDWYYSWDVTAPSELQRALNLVMHYENDTSSYQGMICYIPTRNHTFDYTNTCDSYQSYFFDNSRVFAYRDQHSSFTHYLELGEEMCYCLDSYLGLGFDFINDNLYADERPVSWTVTSKTINPDNGRFWYHIHQLHVEYGHLLSDNQPGIL